MPRLNSAPFLPSLEHNEYIAPSHYAPREDIEHAKEPTVTLNAVTPTSSLRESRKTKLFNGIAYSRPSLTLALSIACFAAMFIVLAVYSNKPLSAWPTQAIPINTVVAALTTAMRASMLVSIADSISQSKWSWFSNAQETTKARGRRLENLVQFDEASRGPWGSFWLLFETKLHLVSIGALLTVLALTLDAFSQQIIYIESRIVVNETASASFPRAETYGKGAVAGSATFGYDQKEWWAGVYAGVYSSAIPDLAVVCPTGNCTWPVIPSMGVCGACADITDTLKVHCSGSYCNYTTPKGPMFTGGVGPGTSGGPTYGTESGLVELTNAPSPNSTFGPWTSSDQWPAFPMFNVGLGGGLIFKDMDDPHVRPGPGFQPIAQFDIIVVENKSDSLSSPLSFHPPVATSCGLWFCLQAYSTNVKLGKLQQSVIANYSMNPDGKPIDVSQVPSIFNISHSARIYYPKDVAEDLFYGPNMDGLYSFFNGSGYWHVGMQSFTTTSNQMQAMWGNAGDYDSWISRLAKSLSNIVRSTAPSLPLAEGDVLTSQIFIRVRWLWVILPGLIVLGAIMFFTASAIRLQKNHENLWQDSPLVLLLSDVDVRLKGLAETHFGSAQELGKVLGQQRVTLSQRHDGTPMFQSI